MCTLVVKPSPRLGTIRGLRSFQLLEPLELGRLAGLAADHACSAADEALLDEERALARADALPARSERRPRPPSALLCPFIASRRSAHGDRKPCRDDPRERWG